MDKQKYNRVAQDASMLQRFADEVCDEMITKEELQEVLNGCFGILYKGYDDILTEEEVEKLLTGKYALVLSSDDYLELFTYYPLYKNLNGKSITLFRISEDIENIYYYILELDFAGNTAGLIYEDEDNMAIGGTKLYQHHIMGLNFGFYIISKNPTPLLKMHSFELVIGKDYLVASYENEGDNWGYAPVYIAYTSNNTTFSVIDNSSQGSSIDVSIADWTDTVTEL